MLGKVSAGVGQAAMPVRPTPESSLRSEGVGQRATAFRAEKFADGTDTPISGVESTQQSLWGKVAVTAAIFAPTPGAVVSHKWSNAQPMADETSERRGCRQTTVGRNEVCVN